MLAPSSRHRKQASLGANDKSAHTWLIGRHPPAGIKSKPPVALSGYCRFSPIVCSEKCPQRKCGEVKNNDSLFWIALVGLSILLVLTILLILSREFRAA